MPTQYFLLLLLFSCFAREVYPLRVARQVQNSTTIHGVEKSHPARPLVASNPSSVLNDGYNPESSSAAANPELSGTITQTTFLAATSTITTLHTVTLTPPVAKGPGCIPDLRHRILNWNQYVKYVKRPNAHWPTRLEHYGDTEPVLEEDLQSSGLGFVWIEDEHAETPFYTIFQNSHNWKLVNCVDKFGRDSVEKGGCTTGDVALYYQAISEGMEERGIIGTTRASVYPSRSPWTIYCLRSFRITPVANRQDVLDSNLTVSVKAWNEAGILTGWYDVSITGGSAGYLHITLPVQGFSSVLQWQVHIHDSSTYFDVLLDEVTITEWVYNKTACPYGSPSSTNSTLRTLNFLSRGNSSVVTSGYAFGTNTSYVSLYAAAAHRHHRPFPPSSMPALPLSPRGLYTVGQTQLLALSTLFDPISFTLRIDLTTLPPGVNVTDLSLVLETNYASLEKGDGQRLNLPVVDERVVVALKRIRAKVYGVQLMPVPEVGWWLESALLAEWGEWSGTRPCGQFGRWICEWPQVARGSR